MVPASKGGIVARFELQYLLSKCQLTVCYDGRFSNTIIQSSTIPHERFILHSLPGHVRIFSLRNRTPGTAMIGALRCSDSKQILFRGRNLRRSVSCHLARIGQHITQYIEFETMRSKHRSRWQRNWQLNITAGKTLRTTPRSSVETLSLIDMSLPSRVERRTDRVSTFPCQPRTVCIYLLLCVGKKLPRGHHDAVARRTMYG